MATTRCSKCGQLGQMSRTCRSQTPAGVRAPRGSQFGRNFFMYLGGDDSATDEKLRRRNREGLEAHVSRDLRAHVGDANVAEIPRATSGLDHSRHRRGHRHDRRQAVHELLRECALCARLQGGKARPWYQGSGGAVATLFSAVMPLGMGSIAGLTQVAVVHQDETPRFIPFGLLRSLMARICCDIRRTYCGVIPTASSDMSS